MQFLFNKDSTFENSRGQSHFSLNKVRPAVGYCLKIEACRMASCHLSLNEIKAGKACADKFYHYGKSRECNRGNRHKNMMKALFLHPSLKEVSMRIFTALLIVLMVAGCSDSPTSYVKKLKIGSANVNISREGMLSFSVPIKNKGSKALSNVPITITCNVTVTGSTPKTETFDSGPIAAGEQKT